MPLRKTTGTLYLFREGKKISLKPGELVDLSSDELKQIKAINPDALEHPSEADIELHELRNASRSAVVAKDADGPATPAKKPAASKKKPAATAGAADAETAAAATAAAAAAATEGGDTNKAAEDDEDEDL